MARLLLFRDERGIAGEFVVIEEQGLTDEDIIKEYGALPVEDIDVGPLGQNSFPTDQPLVDEGGA